MDNFEIFALVALLSLVFIPWVLVIGDLVFFHKVTSSVTADSVVRCKDCAVPHNRWTGCPKMNGTVMPPEGFCSYGERREDNR